MAATSAVQFGGREGNAMLTRKVYSGTGRMEDRSLFDSRNFNPLVLSMASIGYTILAFIAVRRVLSKPVGWVVAVAIAAS